MSVSSVCPCGQIMHGEARGARKWWANDGCQCSAASLRDRLLSRALITTVGLQRGQQYKHEAGESTEPLIEDFGPQDRTPQLLNRCSQSELYKLSHSKNLRE